MIQVSNTYNPYTTVRDVDMVVSLDVINHEAAEDATYTSTSSNIGTESFSNLTQLNNLDYEDVKYATCEDDLVMLDGSWQYLNSTITNEHIGYWSHRLSHSDSYYTSQWQSTPACLTATLSSKVNCVGFVIYCSKTNPITECAVRVKRSDSLHPTVDEIVYEQVFTSDTNIIYADVPATNFDKVEIIPIKSEYPYRRVKILGFQFGLIKQWNRNEIVSASITEEASVSGETLPINELNVEFDNSTNEFNVLGSGNIYIPADIMNNASASATDKHDECSVGNLPYGNESSNGYATCEDDLVMLDGTWQYMLPQQQYYHGIYGYMNNTLSDSNGEFDNVASVTYSWYSEVADILGIRFYFAKYNYATSITISAYVGNDLINSETFENDNENILDVEFGVSGFDKLVFTFNSVPRADRYVKVQGIQLLRHKDSWINYLTQNQKLSARFVINGESVSMGDNYLFDKLEQTNGGLTAKITAKNYIRQLDNQTYIEARHGTDTISNALSELLSGSGLSVQYSSSTVANRNVSLSAPKGTTRRAAIHYYAQAARATCFLGRDNVLQIRPLDVSDYVDSLDYNNMYNRDIVRMNDYVNMIRLTVKDEYVDPPFEQTYYGGSGLYYREIENHCVYQNELVATAVANWLLDQKNRRIYFEIEARGNPAVEIGDTIRVKANDGSRYLAVVYYQNFEYNGGLKATIKAIANI